MTSETQKGRGGMERFRITTWPAAPVPPIQRVPAPPTLSVVDGSIVRGPVVRGQGWRVVEVPPELYLRELRQMDLDDEASITRFVDTYSWLGVGGSGRRYLPMAFRRDLPEPVDGAEHLDEFAAGVRWIRDLTTIYADHMAGDLDKGPGSWESADVFLRGAGIGRPTDEGRALHVLSKGLDLGLVDFRPHMVIKDADGQIRGPATSEPTLFVALIVQLFNHIVEGAQYHRCQNETCGRLFYRQQGRSAHGQHRTIDVQYCTSKCAKAQAQREYRRRQRSTKEQS